MEDCYPSRRQSEPGILDREDPVVHSTWMPASPLTRAQAEQFDSQGYLVLENILTPDEIALLQEEARVLLADPAKLDERTIITERNSSEIRSIFRIHAQSALVSRLVADERLAERAKFLLGDDVYIHQSRLNYKPGLRGKEFFWHSDFETWHVEDGMPRMRAISMSLLLTKNVTANGPLMVIPGSHRKFVRCAGATPANNYLTSLKKQDYGVPDDDILAELVHEHGIVELVGEPGTLIVFDCNLMHGSNSNITPYPRANAFFVYNAVSNRLVEPFGAPTPRPDFVGARLVEPITPITDFLKGRAA